MERAPVKTDDRVKPALRGAVEAALLAFGLVAQQFGAHHRCQRQRNDCRHENRNCQRHRKLAEQPPDDVSHEQQWNQHGDQRNRQRKNGEADLLRALERRLQGRITLLNISADVLDHDDRVVHNEARRNRQRHQRKVVEAVADEVHHAERADNRERHGHARDERGGETAQEKEHHHDDQRKSEHQLELHVRNRSADRRRSIGQHLHINRRGKRRLASWARSAAWCWN